MLLAEQGLLLLRSPVADGTMTEVLLHSEEELAVGDRAYTRKNRNLGVPRREA